MTVQLFGMEGERTLRGFRICTRWSRRWPEEGDRGAAAAVSARARVATRESYAALYFGPVGEIKRRARLFSSGSHPILLSSIAIGATM